MYCKRHHSKEKNICDNCKVLNNYAELRIKKCKFTKEKPVCSKCQIHCYKKDMKREIKIIMRWSGPRMIWHYPIDTIKYLYYKNK